MEKELIPYIQTALNQGKSKDDIYRELMNVGWSVDAIASAYSLLKDGTIPPTVRIPVPPQSVKSEEARQEPVIEQKSTDTAPHQKTSRVILVIGAIFIGLGVFSFIAGNWQGMTASAKVLIIVVAMLISYVIAFVMNMRGYEKTGNAFLLLGSLIYGGGIFLIAQIFHLPVEWPDGFLLWFIGVVALGYATEWRPLVNVATLIGFIGAIGYPWSFFESLFSYYDNRVPVEIATVSVVVLIVALVASIFVGARVRALLPEEIRNRF